MAKSPAWTRKAGQSKSGGLNAKGRASYNRATGGNLKAPVTQKNPRVRLSLGVSLFVLGCGMKKD